MKQIELRPGAKVVCVDNVVHNGYTLYALELYQTYTVQAWLQRSGHLWLWFYEFTGHVPVSELNTGSAYLARRFSHLEHVLNAIQLPADALP